MRTAFWDNESDSPRMTTRTDITKQNTSLIASAIKFTDAGRKSYLFSVIKKKIVVTTFKILYIAKSNAKYWWYYGTESYIKLLHGGVICYLHWLRILVIGYDWFPRWQNPDPEPKCRLKILSTAANRDRSSGMKKRRTGPLWRTWAEAGHRRMNMITEKTSDNHINHAQSQHFHF